MRRRRKTSIWSLLDVPHGVKLPDYGYSIIKPGIDRSQTARNKGEDATAAQLTWAMETIAAWRINLAYGWTGKNAIPYKRCPGRPARKKEHK